MVCCVGHFFDKHELSVWTIKHEDVIEIDSSPQTIDQLKMTRLTDEFMADIS